MPQPTYISDAEDIERALKEKLEQQMDECFVCSVIRRRESAKKEG